MPTSRMRSRCTSNNQTIDREKDLFGRGLIIWHFNDWFSIAAGGGTGTFTNETTSPNTAQGIGSPT